MLCGTYGWGKLTITVDCELLTFLASLDTIHLSFTASVSKIKYSLTLWLMPVLTSASMKEAVLLTVVICVVLPHQ